MKDESIPAYGFQKTTNQFMVLTFTLLQIILVKK